MGGVIFNEKGNISLFNNNMSHNSAGLGQMMYHNGSMRVLNLIFIGNSTWVVRNGETITVYAKFDW